MIAIQNQIKIFFVYISVSEYEILGFYFARNLRGESVNLPYKSPLFFFAVIFALLCVYVIK